MTQINFTINSQKIIKFNEYNDASRIGRLFAKYSPLYQRDKEKALKELSRINNHIKPVIWQLRKVLSFGHCEIETNTFALANKGIAMIIRIINLAKYFEIPLDCDRSNLHQDIGQYYDLTYKNCLDLLEAMANHDLKYPLGVRELNRMYQNTTIQVIKKYLEFPYVFDFLDFIMSDKLIEHKKFLLNLATHIRLDCSHPITITDRIEVLNIILNYLRRCFVASPDLEKYIDLLIFLEHLDNPIKEKAIFTASILVYGNYITCYVNLKDRISQALDLIIMNEDLSLTSDEFIMAFTKIYDRYKCQYQYHPIKWKKYLKKLIIDYWDFFMSLVMYINSPSYDYFSLHKLFKYLPSEIELGIHLRFNCSVFYDKTRQVTQIYNTIYKIRPFDTSKLTMNNHVRQFFNKTLGIVPGRLTKPAIKK